MSSEWRKFGWGPWPAEQRVPEHAPDAGEAKGLGLPPTIRPVAGAEQAPVFDPAMQHHTKAMRPSEPRFRSPEFTYRWYVARRRAVDHVLAAVAASRWADHLVLRGSMLLRAWYGAEAREPGDLDFVVVPQSWDISGDPTESMLDGIAQGAEEMSWRDPDDPVHLDAAGAVRSSIWTYDRVPGLRLLVPWKAEGLPSSTVQLDFVFNEYLPAEPELTGIPRADGGEPATVNAASPELSLAWKLAWLLTDAYPQGKDLYDAWLLASRVTLPYELLTETLGSYFAGRPLKREDFDNLDVEWDEFRKDYPSFKGEATEYIWLLTEALSPTFAQAAEQHPGE